MADFITKSLEPGEQVVLKGRLHWSAIWKYFLAMWILVLLGLGIGIWMLVSHKSLLVIPGVLLFIALCVYLVGRVVRTRTEFCVTNTRFIQKDGIFNIHMTEIPLFKVETVNYSQSFFQRFLGTGCIELVGSGGTNHNIHHIQNPMTVRRTIVSVINQQDKNPKREA